MTATVHAAIAAITAELPAIGKDSNAPQAMGGYPFRGLEAITRHAQPLLAKHGLVIAPRSTITNVVPSPAMKEGWQDIYLQVEWLITGPDGSTITAQTNGIGRDNSDKGANKAQSQAFKYLLLQLFCIADAKDDADNQTYEHDRVEAPKLPDGWASWDELEATWDDLRADTAALEDDVRAEVQAELKKLKFTKRTFSVQHAEAWARLLPAEVSVGGGDLPSGTNGRAESVAAPPPPEPTRPDPGIAEPRTKTEVS